MTGITPPKLDERGFEELLKEFQDLVPFYTKEWNPSGKDPGFALSKIFLQMMGAILQRLNRAPEKNFLAFLDKLGTKLLTAQPAMAPVTFQLSEGTEDHILIQERTQVGAGDLIFETEKNLLATPAKLLEAFSIDVQNDAIYKSPTNIVSGEPVVPFQAKLLYEAKEEEKEIFLNSTEGLKEGDTLLIDKLKEKFEYAVVSKVTENKVSLADELENAHDADSPVEKVTSFELFEGKNLQEHILYLGHKSLFNLKRGSGDGCFVRLKIYLTGVSSWEGSDFDKLAKSKWEYWGEDPENGEGKWISFEPVESGKVDEIWLEKKCGKPTKQKEISGIESFWIRCIGSKEYFELPQLESINVSIENSNGPDMCFYNDVPLSLNDEGFHPFGKRPKVYDTFYIASQENFSKKGENIRMNFNLKCPGTAMDELTLSWEYWDGKGWQIIKDLSPEFNFESSSCVSFTCPSDIQLTEINGQRNYWIRVKIVNGTYTLVGSPPQIGCIKIQIEKPLKSNLESCFTLNNLEYTELTEASKSNNSKYLTLFCPSEDKHNSLYLGFNRKIEKGPVSLFFWIEEQAWSYTKIPAIQWEYYTESEKWERLEVSDETKGLLRTGTIEFAMPLDFKKKKKFGKELYWVRAVDVAKDEKNRFKPIKIAYAQHLAEILQLMTVKLLHKLVIKKYLIPALKFYEPRLTPEEELWPAQLEKLYKDGPKSIKLDHLRTIKNILHSITVNRYDMQMIRNLAAIVPIPYKPQLSPHIPPQEEPSIEPCPELLETFHPDWDHPKEVKGEIISPQIKVIFLNTTWAIQAESIRDESLGSSEGTDTQNFTFSRSPIVSEEVWVDEISSISEEEKKLLAIRRHYEIKEIRDEKGKLTEFWVKWRSTEDLLASSKDDRHYEIDKISAEVKFGDGTCGKIPPIGKDNIKANYRTGGGSKGNAGAYELKDLKTSVPFVDKVLNPLPAGGGADVEKIEKVIKKGPKILKHRNRAITAEDFEELTYLSSRSIARAKCLPNFDDKGEFTPGWVTVIVIPESKEDKPGLSLQLKREIENYLKERSANTVIEKNHLQVSEPVYVEVSIDTIIITASVDQIPDVEKRAFDKLRSFLHPLYGGYEDGGWEFGRAPCLSDFYALLEKIEGVDYVRNLSLYLRTYDDGQILDEFILTPEKRVDIKIPPYAIIYSGKHNISVNFESANLGGINAFA